MSHTSGDPKLLARIRRMRGQLDAVEKAIESGVDCSTVLQQVAAVRGAANGLMTQMLENHLREHLLDSEAPMAQREADFEPVVGILRSYLK